MAFDRFPNTVRCFMSLTVGIHAHFESAVAEGRMVRTVVYWPVRILRNLLMIPATVNAAQLLAEAYSSHPCTVKPVFAGPCAKRNPVLIGQVSMHQSAVDRTCIPGSSGILSYRIISNISTVSNNSTSPIIEHLGAALKKLSAQSPL